MNWNLNQLEKIANSIDWNFSTPSRELAFRVFKDMLPKDVKVVILGQDPYPKQNVAIGRAFAVNLDTQIPRSLKNIFWEIKENFGVVKTDSTLQLWVNQGVFLINKNLSTKLNCPNAHNEIWNDSVLKILQQLALFKNDIVWVLWGKEAQKLRDYLPKDSIIINNAHPSPYSFMLRTHNDFLKINEIHKIEW